MTSKICIGIACLATLLCIFALTEGGKRKKNRKSKPPEIVRPDDYDYYDTKYPQYLYKPDYIDCNRDEYFEYKRYLRSFKENWYNREKYPTYKVGREDRIKWDSYGTYDYEGTYPTGTNKPGKKGACCYEFTKLLPRRSIRPPPLLGRIRQEYRTLSDDNRNAFHAAMNSLKSSGYDTFVGYHRESVSPHAHGGASFLPWHREFLFRLENALNQHNYTGGLPYFDSTLDVNLPVPADSAIWTDSYLGNIDGVVTSGFAQGWPSIPECTGIGPTLTRNGRRTGRGQCYLFTDFDIDYVYNKRCFRDITCNTDCKFEADHAGVHAFVGGHMSNPSCAPSDPVFFLHHAFVDCIWETFRQNHQQSDITREYPSAVNGDDVGSPPPFFSIPNGFEWYSPMSPVNALWNPISAFPGVLNGHGIQNFYSQYYKCKDRPMKCSNDTVCNSRILWCNNGRCMAKVKQDGNCGTLPDNACAGPCLLKFTTPACINSVCTCKSFVIDHEVPDSKHNEPAIASPNKLPK